jgi:hypothetical protein
MDNLLSILFIQVEITETFIDFSNEKRPDFRLQL